MRDQLPEEHLTRYALDAFFQCAATLFYVTTEDNAAQLMKKVYHTNDASILDICELSALATIGSYCIIDKVDDAARARYFFLATTNLNEAVQAYDIQGLRIFICLCMSCIMDKSLSARLLVMSGLNLARARTEAETERSDSSGRMCWSIDGRYRRRYSLKDGFPGPWATETVTKKANSTW
jgi:hypothetical protein